MQRYAYVATFRGEEVCGTCALVGELARDDVRFGFVACNDNCALSEWNTYPNKGRMGALEVPNWPDEQLGRQRPKSFEDH